MYGPKPNGFWSKNCRYASPPLALDQTYRVVRAFVDFDHAEHPVGETWTFVGSSFLPHDEGLSLFVQNDEGEWHIRLQLYPDKQERLWREFKQYVELVGPGAKNA